MEVSTLLLIDKSAYAHGAAEADLDGEFCLVLQLEVRHYVAKHVAEFEVKLVG